MNRFALMASGIFMLAAAPASAQALLPSGFSGIRAEVRGGADIVSLDLEGANDSRTGLDYSGEVGFDFDLGGAVIGAYAGVGGSTFRACEEIFGGDEFCVRAGRDITAGVRVGTPLSLTSLIYVKGGYSNGRIRGTYIDFDFPENDFEDGENLDGFHLGGGIEFDIMQNAYVKAEYNYSNYSSNADDLGLEASLDRHRILGGVGFRF